MKTVAKITFLIWIALWALFTIRPLVKNSYLTQYIALFGHPLNERRAIVYGRNLYSFLEHAKHDMPENATYALKGFEDGSIDVVRAEYYLYPCLKSGDPRFVLTRGKN